MQLRRLQRLLGLEDSDTAGVVEHVPERHGFGIWAALTGRRLPMDAGAVVSLFRYPVKSMMGEELNSSPVDERGLLGDRRLALVDVETGKVVSAKHPRKWDGLFSYRAAFVSPPIDADRLPAVRITLPDGDHVTSDAADADRILSALIGRKVRVSGSAPASPQLEEYWPDMEELDFQDTVTEEAMPSERFFDAAAVHVLTTATLARLRELYPEGRFEVRRFRPNIVIDTDGPGFVENDWVGRTLGVGEDVRLQVVRPCPRCVMTTLPQGDLPKDSGILRTAARHNQAHVGVYAEVEHGGLIRRGDRATLLE